MKKDIMKMLVCPVCRGELELKIAAEEDDEVITGSMFCQKCDEAYPIEGAVANLLPPEMRT